jgi:hypothetical protein
VDWLRDEAQAAGADLRTGDECDAESVLAERPDAVIIATGSILRPDAVLPGPIPVLDVDVLLDGADGRGPGHALVLDDEGGFLAPTAAEVLSERGFTVEIATTHPSVGALIDPTQLPFVLRRLARDRVGLTPNVQGIAAEDGRVTLRHVYSEESEQRAGIDLIVMAGRRKGLTTLRDGLRTADPAVGVVVVGDALAPRTLLDAVSEGARAGATVEAGVRAVTPGG